MRFDLDGRTLAYDVAGPADAPPVLLMHGLSDARAAWRAVSPVLADDYRVFAYDHRGHGESDRTPETYLVGHYGDDAIAFLERVVGGPAAVVGHSLGGLVGAHIASKRPDLVARSFLEDPPLYLGDKEAFGATVFAMIFPMAQQMLRDMRDRQASVDDFVAMVQALPAMMGEGTLGDFLGDEGTQVQAVTWRNFDPEAYSPAIDVSLFAGFDPATPIPNPVRLLRAERELGAAFFPEHEQPFVATHPRAEVELVAGASHLIHIDHQDEFVTDLRDFLKRTA